MHYLDLNSLEALIDHKETPAVSIFLPTHPKDINHEKDRILLKQAIKKAEENLIEHYSTREIDQFLAPVQELYSDKTFWSSIKEGLAIFVGPEFFKVFRTPGPLDSRVIVNSHFHLPPLVPYFESEQSLYLLALSQNHVRLFEANSLQIQEIDLKKIEGVPQSLEHFLRFDEFEPQLQHHSRQGNSIYHGHGDEGYPRDKQIENYCKAIAKALNPMLENSKYPLVLACVDELHGVFSKHCAYEGLQTTNISGNPDQLSARELHQELVEQVEPLLHTQRQKALKRLNDLYSTEKTSIELKEVAQAAFNSRVQTLFVLKEEGPKGQIDTETNQVKVISGGIDESQDLINMATLHTVLNGGEVFSLDAGEIEGATQLAAILRY